MKLEILLAETLLGLTLDDKDSIARSQRGSGGLISRRDTRGCAVAAPSADPEPLWCPGRAVFESASARQSICRFQWSYGRLLPDSAPPRCESRRDPTGDRK